jgi:hypothetical protein
VLLRCSVEAHSTPGDGQEVDVEADEIREEGVWVRCGENSTAMPANAIRCANAALVRTTRSRVWLSAALLRQMRNGSAMAAAVMAFVGTVAAVTALASCMSDVVEKAPYPERLEKEMVERLDKAQRSISRAMAEHTAMVEADCLSSEAMASGRTSLNDNCSMQPAAKPIAGGTSRRERPMKAKQGVAESACGRLVSAAQRVQVEGESP